MGKRLVAKSWIVKVQFAPMIVGPFSTGVSIEATTMIQEYAEKNVRCIRTNLSVNCSILFSLVATLRLQGQRGFLVLGAAASLAVCKQSVRKVEEYCDWSLLMFP